jgi:hypothetical protein
MSSFLRRARVGRLLPLVVLASLGLSTCSRREGLNFACQWVADPPFRIDLGTEAHVQHLLDDVRVAEELGIRYGDRMAGWRLVETFGIVSRHGGLKDRDTGRQAQQECTATLLHTVGSTHGVTASDIDAVRPRLQERGLDLPVTIPVALLLMGAVTRFTRWISRRFEADEWLAWIVATLLGSLLIPALVLAIGGAWAVVVEIARVGNEHLGHRARGESLRANFLVVLGIGTAAVWIGSAMSAIRTRTESRIPRCPTP